MALDPDLRKILQTNMHAIATSVQLQHLLPFLRKSDLITDPEFENLSASTRESNHDRNQRMVSIILQKGKDAFDLFVTALQSEKLHIGHKSLAETLQAAKKNLKSHARLLVQCSSPLHVLALIDLLNILLRYWHRGEATPAP